MMRTRRFLPTPIGFTIVLFGLSMMAGGAATKVLYDWSPWLAISQAAVMLLLLYGMSRFVARAPALGWRFAVPASLFGLTVVSWMVIAVYSYPARPRQALPAFLAAMGLIGCLLAAIFVPLIVLVVGAGAAPALRWSRGRPSAVVVDVALWLLLVAFNLTGLVAVLAFAPRGISALLTLLLALSLMPVLSWIVWGTLHIWALRHWRLEQAPTRLESVLAELRRRTGVSFRRVLCLDDSFGSGRRCEVVTTPAGHTLIVSAGVATSIDDSELLALLAHEIGHVRLGHGGRRVIAGMVAGILTALIGTAALYVLSPRLPVGLVSALAVAVVLVNVRGLYTTGLVRAQELEADRFAADVAGAEALTSALTKLGFTGPRSAVVHHRWTTHGTWEVRSRHLRAQRLDGSKDSHS